MTNLPFITNEANRVASLSKYSGDSSLAEDLVGIVNKHALGSAAASAAVAWVPAGGVAAALAASVGILWTMYFRINNRLGIKIGKNLLKTLASAVISNLSQYAIAAIGTSILLSLTGIGSLASTIIMAALNYAVVLVGGDIYMRMMFDLFRTGKDPEAMTSEEFAYEATNTIAKTDTKDMLKKANSAYKTGRKDGSIKGNEYIDEEKDDSFKGD